ncbi:MAG: MFS transporter [Bryobacteraceae bacterium]
MKGIRRWRIAILLGVGVLINYFDRVNVSVAQDALNREFGMSNQTFGYVLSAYSWTYAALQLPMGVLLDRFGVRLIGCLSALIWSIASFAGGAATSVGGFVASRLLLGVGEAPTFPASSKATGAWFPRQERSLATAMFDASSKFASAIGVPMIGFVLIKLGWRLSFAVTGLISFLYFVAFFFVYREPKDDPKLTPEEWEYIRAGGAQQHREPGASKSASLGFLMTRQKVLGLVLGFFAYNYCFYLFLTWLPSYFSRSLGIDLLHSVLFTAIPWSFATLTDLLVGGWLVDFLIRRGHPESKVRKTILIGGTTIGLAVAGVVFARTPWQAVFWLTISLGGLAAAAPVGWSIPSLIAPRNSTGKVGGILNFGNQIAAVLAPIATGYFAGTNNSFGRAFGAAAVILAIGICGYVFLLGTVEPIPEPHEEAA